MRFLSGGQVQTERGWRDTLRIVWPHVQDNKTNKIGARVCHNRAEFGRSGPSSDRRLHRVLRRPGATSLGRRLGTLHAGVELGEARLAPFPVSSYRPLRILGAGGFVRTWDCGYADVAGMSGPYLVMDFFDGSSLKELV